MNNIRGKVFLEETSQGISNLLVTIYDVEPGKQLEETTISTGSSTAIAPKPGFDEHRIGSILTDKKGEFSFEFDDSEFRDRTHSIRPNILLTVSSPAQKDTKDATSPLRVIQEVRIGAGKTESYIIQLTLEQIKNAGIRLPRAASDDPSFVIDKVAEEINYKNEVQTGVSDLFAQGIRTDREAAQKYRTDFEPEFIRSISHVPSELYDSDRFVKPGDDDIKLKNTKAIKERVEQEFSTTNSAGEPSFKIRTRFFLTPYQRQLLQEQLDSSLDNHLTSSQMKSLLSSIGEDNNKSSSFPTYFLNENSHIQDCLQKFLQLRDFSENGEDAGSGVDPAAIGGDVTPNAVVGDSGNETQSQLSLADIPKYIEELIAPIGPPSETDDTDGNHKSASDMIGNLQGNIDKFSLAPGPADTPAYFDFHQLQIAFEHVWQEVIHKGVAEYASTVFKGLNALGGDPLDDSYQNDSPLSALREEVNLVNNSITNIGIPGGMYFGTRGWQYDDTGEGYGAGYGSNTGGSSGDNSSGQSSDSQDDTNGDSQGGSKNDKDPVKVQIDLINELEQLLNGDYAFTIYAANEKQKSVNYGVHLTNRIRMEPTTYQAGELVKTVTLAPNEVRKYTSKTVIKRKRSEKEAAKSSFVRKEDMSETSRAESEIIRKALTKTNFSLMAQGTYSLGFASGNSTINVGTDAENSSSETKKGFMEAVTKASQEYKSERTVEVAFEESTDFEFTESGEMNNKNDSVAVTYLFFELQRRFRVFQELYRIVPVVLVAQEVPRPDEITDSWIVRYAWILRRSLLSDEFLPAISYLDSHVAGDLAALVHLRKNVKTQDGIVNKLEENLKLLRERTERSYTILQKRMERVASEIEEEDSDGFFGDIGDFFGSGGESPDAARAREAAAREAFERTVKKEQDLAMRLDSAVVALNQAVDELAKAERTHQNHRVQILKLRVHIVQNILYYMQAIWAHEVSDQRFFRLHQVPVPIFEDAGTMYEFSGTEAFKHFVNEGTSFEEAVAHAFEIKPNISVSFDVKTLGEIADLDNPLGFKGNYIIYPLKEGEENALTEFLMMPYIDSGWRAIDPDEAGNMNLEEFEEFVRCLHEHMSEEEFAEIKPKLEEHYSLLITSGVRPGDEIIVPTGSLFIEALPASHYLLERFKEKHRELDVMKVKAEVRGKELRNLRAAARMLAAEDDTSLLDDPDIESVKRVIVSGDGVQPNIDVGSDL